MTTGEFVGRVADDQFYGGVRLRPSGRRRRLAGRIKHLGASKRC